jgi:hypothetical protein
MNSEVIASADLTARWPAYDDRPARIARLSSAAAALVLVFFHCFGCGAHGTVIGFVQCREQHDFAPEGEERYASVVTFGSMRIERAFLVAALRTVLV